MTDQSRLARLHAVKLAALVREHRETSGPAAGGPAPASAEVVPHPFAGGAALTEVVDGRVVAAWVLVADRPERGLGGALVWALRQQAAHVHVVADECTGTLARRAEGFAVPVSVWQVDGRSLRPAVPEPLPVAPSVPESHLALEAVVVAAGADPVVEHGVLAGEVAGLEVCRVVDDAASGAVRLEVGVGAHDRDAFQMLHGDRPTTEALADVVRVVAQHRLHDVHGHPLARLAKERLLRDRLRWDPALVGATSVEPVAPPVPRPNLKDAVPCAAVAEIGGASVLLVCSTGVDLDVVPWAVDARRALSLDRCVIVLPARDALDVQRMLAAAAAPPIDVVTVDDSVLAPIAGGSR